MIRNFAKKKQFQLLDVQVLAVGLQDVLVVPVKEEKVVGLF